MADTSFYQSPPNFLSNPIDTYGTLVGIQGQLQQNQLAAQHVAQAKVNTQTVLDKQGAMQSLQNFKNPDGTNNYNAWLSDVAVNHPLAVGDALALRNQQTALVNAGIIPSGQPNAGAPRQVTQEQLANTMGNGNGQPSAANNSGQQPVTASSEIQQPTTPSSGDPFANAPSVQGGLAPGREAAVKQSMDDVHSVRSAAGTVPIVDAALAKMQELQKQGAGTGTILGAFHQYLAQHNLAYAGAESDAANIQEFQKYTSTIAQAAGARTDQDLNNVIHANPNIEQIGQAIHNLIPYLRATNKGIQIRNNYYTQNGVGVGADPELTAKVTNDFNNNWSARAGEYNSLPPDEKATYVANMSPADRAALKKSIVWEQSLNKQGQQ